MMQLVDLSAAQDTGLALILLRVPTCELLRTCVLVSKQWNRLLSQQKAFWMDKAELDGYKPADWSRLAGLSVQSYQAIAWKQPFQRNFINNFVKDKRWKFIMRGLPKIECPPVFQNSFLPRGEINPTELVSDQMPSACIVVGNKLFTKVIQIRLASEGLTDELMDHFRPTIAVSELVTNRKDSDSASVYEMCCWLTAEPVEYRYDWRYYGHYNIAVKAEDFWEEATQRFEPGQEEGWRHVQVQLRNYPAGMRYLTVRIFGHYDREQEFYGMKMANCTVQALCQRNNRVEIVHRSTSAAAAGQIE